VLGGGFIGCEFAQMFRRFGSMVTIIDRAEHLLATEEPEASAALEGVFRDEGIGLVMKATARSVSGGARAITVRLEGGKKVSGSHLLVAVGRRPNTDDLGGEAAGIRLDAKGYIEVDERYERRGRVGGRRLHAGATVHARGLGRPPHPLRSAPRLRHPHS
jgi:pyruvate/2-oxoglutarate dehydrogenase complex dihydrolipoamide dehydrogenase (E3) component